MGDKTERVDAYLVAGGKYHDIDFARLELLKLLAEHENVRVTVGSDYSDLKGIAASSFLITYTCDVRPTEEQQDALVRYIEGGGRWLALHGTNAALNFVENGVESPRIFPKLANLLGSQFVAHPPIQPYRVEKRNPNHPLVHGIEEFDTDDELYLCEYHDFEKLEVLLDCRYSGKAQGFIEDDWTQADRHLVMYIRPLGEGAVLYNTLGHCRGHWDMRPAMDYYPQVERCSWDKPQFYELVRRGLRWCLRQL